jgi:ankyrin repeat protein
MFGDAYKGRLDAIRTLVELGADFNVLSNSEDSPLSIALQQGQIVVSIFLVNIETYVKKCLQDLKPEEVEHIRDILSQFCDSVGLRNNNDD